jgi:hypothetical protein
MTPRDLPLNNRTRALWLAGALLMGVISQWCTAFGPCATGPIRL